MSESMIFEAGNGQGAMMEEGRRQAYLAALGVDLYAARQALPHAAPSWFPEWEVEACWENESTQPTNDSMIVAEGGVGFVTYDCYSPVATNADERAGNAIRPESVAQATRQLVEQSALVKGIPPAQPVVATGLLPGAELTVPVLRNLKSEPTQQKPKADAPVRLRVGLSVFEWPGKLRVLIEMIDPDAPSLSAREHRLWQEIALALWGRDQAYEAQAIPMFRFPPNVKLRHLETPEAVREAVDSFLQARHGRSPVGLQAMFAGPGLAAAYLGQRGAKILQPYLVTVPGGTQSFLLPGLAQLLEDWQLKPPVWQVLATAFRQAGLA